VPHLQSISSAASIGAVALPLIQPREPWQGVRLFCTTRQGGVGQVPYDTLNLGLGAQDNPATVLENRKRLRQVVPNEPNWLKQVHGARVVDADDLRLFQEGQEPPAADASVSTTPGRVLAVLTADCLSVVLADRLGTVVGVAHAGWKGLAAGVLEATLSLMQAKRPRATDWRAWIGPGIGAQAFQVGEDVRLAFQGQGAEQPGYFVPDPLEPGKWRADLAGLACWRLAQMGVALVENSGLCTVNDPKRQFFSYRRDRQTGRMATLAWLT
jgi:YfiH family protein